MVGEHTSLDDLRAFAAGCEVVTFDHEHVPGGLLEALEAEGAPIAPGSAALRHAQDKLVMRERLSALGVPVPPFTPVATRADVEGFARHVGWPLVLKAATGGYDGKGVWVVADARRGRRGPAQRRAAAGRAARAAARASWPPSSPARRTGRPPRGRSSRPCSSDGICVETVAPAPGLSEDLALEAQGLALRLADELGVVGRAGGRAVRDRRRPASSTSSRCGRTTARHWTIEGARTSQFEQHLRAVLDYPLGDTAPTAPWVVMANLLGGDRAGGPARRAAAPRCSPATRRSRSHLYGKTIRPGRKIGHVTALGDDLDDVRRRAREGAHYLRTRRSGCRDRRWSGSSWAATPTGR